MAGAPPRLNKPNPAPYGYDRWGNPLPPPGAENFAPSGATQYDDSGNQLPGPENDLIPQYPLPQAMAQLPDIPVGNVPTPSPASGGGGGGTTQSGGPTLAQVSQPFQAPTPQALPQVPTFNAPAYTPPPAFSFGGFQAPGAFTAPDQNAVLNDPGYQFRKQQANDAFMGNRAASGTAHTGGTVKDFLDYNQNMASQEYGNVWNRDYTAYNANFNNALNAYAANRSNAVGNYNTNYQTQYQDPWNISNVSRQEEFAPQLVGYQTNAANTQHQNDVSNQNSWQDYLQRWQVFQGLFDDRFRAANA